MDNFEKFLPKEFQSGNSVPVPHVLLSRQKMLKIIEEIYKEVVDKVSKEG